MVVVEEVVVRMGGVLLLLGPEDRERRRGEKVSSLSTVAVRCEQQEQQEH